MGVIFEGRDPAGRPVAVKVLRSDDWGSPDSRQALTREVAALQRVHNPHIVQLLDFDLEGDSPYLVMELVEGSSLDIAIPEGGLDDEAATRIAEQLLQGISSAHQEGVAHQDLKPSNVLLSDAGVKIIDFGIAAIAQSSNETSLTLGTSGQGSGATAWLSPEQIQGMPGTAQSDVFAWGLVADFAATGRNPFGAGRPEAVMFSIVNDEPDVGRLSRRLGDAILASLNKDASERPTPAQLLATLRDPQVPTGQFHAPPSSPDGEPAGSVKESPTNRRAWLPWAVAGVAIVAAIGIGVIASTRLGSEEPAPEADGASDPRASGPQVINRPQLDVVPEPTVALGETFTMASGVECRVNSVKYGSVKRSGGRTVTVNYFVRNTGDYRQNSCRVGLAWDSSGQFWRPQVGAFTFNPNRAGTDYQEYSVAANTQLTRIKITSGRGSGEEVLDVPPPSGS